jgi:hypothetical protein
VTCNVGTVLDLYRGFGLMIELGTTAGHDTKTAQAVERQAEIVYGRSWSHACIGLGIELGEVGESSSPG